ncbi:kelch-like protein 10 isoform X2 [Zootermopsis nevadensis]|uniref:kelch-like protein 10 isoform X2 n=1 Tax=Zootermopsis nevadensis TaxID=136037 RepID=UPI000B8E3028|nr:kelch-like protein 10 isoform X2 [Zootermopsis nevadensis]
MELNQHSCCSQHGRWCICTEALLALNDLRQKTLLCDAVLRLEDGGVFPVHRVILSACSTYFRYLFTTFDTKEQNEILLQGISSYIMTQILDYVYLRKIHIHCDNVCQLLVTADYLCVLSVLELCCEFLKHKLGFENCIGIMLFARCYFCTDLENHARRFILRHFVQVSQQSEELLELPAEELQAIIGSEDLNVKNEKVVWECILRWINHDPDNRKSHFVDLFMNVRIGLLETRFFHEKVRNHPYVKENMACKPMIVEMLTFLYDVQTITKKAERVLLPKIAYPRIPQDILFAIGGYRDGIPTDVIETYDTRADRWINMEEVDPFGPRGYHGTAVIGFNIYVLGGFNDVEYLNSCRCFNAVTKTWSEVAPMNSCRSYFCVAVLGEVVYAIGGHNGFHRFKTAERYDYNTNQWSLIAPMSTERSDASATELNGKIYVVGGFNGWNYMNSAEVYGPETNQWTLISPMLSQRTGVACTALHGCVYAIGGFNGISRVCSGEKYNPATNTWTQIPEMYEPRSNFAIEVMDDMIFAIGGFGNVDATYCVECYDEITNTCCLLGCRAVESCAI